MILIVDDRPENILPLRKILELHNYETDFAESGEAALKKVLKNTYSLIILDVQMTGMDGFEVAEAMMGYSKSRTTPIIFLSAVSKEKKFVTRGYESGAIDYITKPVDPDILILKVKTFTRLFEQTQEIKAAHAKLEKEIEIRKNTQAELKKANASLEEKVNERTSELTKKNHELETANHELQQFAWVVSHDLIEPLRKIITFNHLIRDRFLVQSDEAENYINRSISAAARMNTLIRDLLDYSRLTNEAAFEPSDVNHIVKELLSDLHEEITRKNATVHLSEFPLMEVIPGQIRQVFQNLILNALKFSADGRDPVIEITAERINEKKADGQPDTNGDYCRIVVKDNGIGFDNKFLDRIFVIFQRLHKEKNYEGTGIGLAIVNKIVARHKGVIDATGKEGEGASFCIVLPLKHKIHEQIIQ